MIDYYKLEVSAKSENFTPPFFIGYLLRDAFAVAFKKVICINKTYSCPFCIINDKCNYFKFFEEENRTLNYRFDIKLKPKDIEFKLFLFEENIETIPYILNAITKMFNEVLFKITKERFKITKIICNGKTIFDGKEFKLKCPHQVFKLNSSYSNYSNINLRFLTPLRIKENNHLLKTNPNLETILQSILNRLNELKGVKKSRLPFVPQFKITNVNMSFLDLARFSKSEKKEVNLSGVVGEIKINSIDKQSLALLKLGEIIGVGKDTSLGLGKIEVEEIN